MHIQLYEEIIKGRFRPFLPKYSEPTELKNILKEAQLQTIAVLTPGQEIDAVIEECDYRLFGFKEVSDMDFTKKSINGKTVVIASPTTVYEGCEVLDIPNYTSFKTNIFMEMIMDEFERVKIRAERKLEITDDRKDLAIYAEKHIAKLKKFFYDAKTLLKDNHHRDDIYILLALSMVLIRTILFYQKMFKQFINTSPDNADQLKSELFSNIALGRLKVLFDMRGSQYCSFIKKSFLQSPDGEPCHCEGNPVASHETFSGKKSLQQDSGLQRFYPLKWNGQLNVLMDIFIQLTEEIKVSGKPILETSPENLRNMIMECFVDGDGKKLSYHTVNTNLKSYRSDKRIKPSSPKKVSIKSIISKPNKE